MATEKNDNNLKMSYLELFPQMSNFVFPRNTPPKKIQKQDLSWQASGPTCGVALIGLINWEDSLTLGSKEGWGCGLSEGSN